MKLKEIKRFLEIYYKRMRKETKAVQQREIKMLWKAIKTKRKQEQLKKKKEKAKDKYNDD